jgi:nicotinamide-nucleotide amidase
MTPNTLLTTEHEIQALIKKFAFFLSNQGRMLATAESCTGGLIAAACTDLAGSSQWFERGFVTYSNQAKTEMLGVAAALIEQHGAVSQAVAQAMAEGALRHSNAQVAVAVTGVAGPSGGSADKPVGTVWFGFALRNSAGKPGKVWTEHQCFGGDRAAIRQATVLYAFQALLPELAELSQP